MATHRHGGSLLFRLANFPPAPYFSCHGNLARLHLPHLGFNILVVVPFFHLSLQAPWLTRVLRSCPLRALSLLYRYSLKLLQSNSLLTKTLSQTLRFSCCCFHTFPNSWFSVCFGSDGPIPGGFLLAPTREPSFFLSVICCGLAWIFACPLFSLLQPLRGLSPTHLPS